MPYYFFFLSLLVYMNAFHSIHMRKNGIRIFYMKNRQPPKYFIYYLPVSLSPPQASGICFSVYTAASFSALQLYTPMREGLTQAGLYGFYACVSAVGIPFTYFFITETSGQQVG